MELQGYHGRINALNKLSYADYKIGIIIAPVILIDNWEILYSKLIEFLYNNLSAKAKKNVFFEVIFMTYSFVHSKINEAVFPSSASKIDLNLMTGRGKGKYMYKKDLRLYGEHFLIDLLKKYFPNNEIKYIV